MATYWKIIKALFAFISEVVLGKNTLKQAFKYDRRRVYVLVIILTSISLNFFTVPRLFSLSYEHYLLKQEVVELQRRVLNQVSQETGEELPMAQTEP